MPVASGLRGAPSRGAGRRPRCAVSSRPNPVGADCVVVEASATHAVVALAAAWRVHQAWRAS
jgi:hypothetical protein